MNCGDRMNREQIYRSTKRKIQIASILDDIIYIVGGVLFFRVPRTPITFWSGFGFLTVAFFLWIYTFIMKSSKKFNKLAEIYDEDNETESVSDAVAEFGWSMTIAGLIFIAGLLIACICLIYFVFHSWIMILFGLMLVNLLSDINDFIQLKNNINKN